MTPNQKHMYRIERTHAWYVQFKRNGIAFERTFPDSKHGGTDEAKEAAVKWRDAFIALNPVNYKRNHPTKRSSTHMVNVSECAEAFHGWWYEGAKRMHQSFAKKKYGDNAIKMAMYVKRIGKRIDPKEWMEINAGKK